MTVDDVFIDHASGAADGGPGGALLTMGLFVPKGEHGERPFHFVLPPLAAAEGGAAPVAHIIWRSHAAAFSGAPALTMTNPFLSEEFHSAAPKVIAFVEMEQLAAVNAFLPALAAEYGMSAFTIDAAHDHAFLPVFGMTRADVPTAVVFDDSWRARDRLPPVGGIELGANLSEPSLRTLLEAFTVRRAKKRKTEGLDGEPRLRTIAFRRGVARGREPCGGLGGL